MSSVVEIMDELAATLAAAFDGNDIAVNVMSRMHFNPSPPEVDIYPADPFRGTDTAGFGDVAGELIFTVRARVGTADHEAGQDVLLSMMDDENDLCVAAVLEEDQSLNGLASSVVVDGPSGFVQFVDAGNAGSLLGVTWTVTVVNSRT